jgi:hypothetical protein
MISCLSALYYMRELLPRMARAKSDRTDSGAKLGAEIASYWVQQAQQGQFGLLLTDDSM